MKPERMKAAELAALGRIAIREVPVPDVEAGDVLLKTLAVGLCGTDVKAYRRGHPFFQPPCVLGHEVVGVVVSVASQVVGIAPGMRLACAPYAECGICAICRRGLGELCNNKDFISGALQEYIRVPGNMVGRAIVPVPAALDDATATLFEPLACAMNGIERARVARGGTVLVIGGGPMGALLALLARARENRVLVSEINGIRRRRLEQLGLAAVDPTNVPLSEALETAFGAPNAEKVLVAVGHRHVAETAVGLTAPGGSVLLFGGLPKGEVMSVDPYDIHYREVSVVGSFGYRLAHFRSAAAWAAEHAGELKQLITAVTSFLCVGDAFAAAERGDEMKIVVGFADAQ